ncbi:MAG: hypothetical protein ABJB11_17460 [Ferruginibacter sp.]
MKYAYSIILLSLILLCSCNGNKAQQKNDPALDSTLAKIDSQVGTFNPAYINDAANSHYAISVNFANNQFTMVPGNAAIRPGRAPYLMNDTSKPFVVKFRDANNKIIGSYSFVNPGLLRACDGKNPNISIKDSIKFEILLPANKEITNLELSNNGKRLTQFTVPPAGANAVDSTGGGVKVQ